MFFFCHSTPPHHNSANCTFKILPAFNPLSVKDEHASALGFAQFRLPPHTLPPRVILAPSLTACTHHKPCFNNLFISLSWYLSPLCSGSFSIVFHLSGSSSMAIHLKHLFGEIRIVLFTSIWPRSSTWSMLSYTLLATSFSSDRFIGKPDKIQCKAYQSILW